MWSSGGLAHNLDGNSLSAYYRDVPEVGDIDMVSRAQGFDSRIPCMWLQVPMTLVDEPALGSVRKG